MNYCMHCIVNSIMSSSVVNENKIQPKRIPKTSVVIGKIGKNYGKKKPRVYVDIINFSEAAVV